MSLYRQSSELMQSQQLDILNPDLSYLKPPDDVYKVKHSDDYIHKVKDKVYHIRKIFYASERYTDFEEEKISELEKEIKRLNIILPEDWDRGKTLKYCLNGQMILEKSIQSLKKHLDWLNDPQLQSLDEESVKYLLDGCLYQFGKDYQYRPVFYINVYRFTSDPELILPQLRSLCQMLTKCLKYCYVKGHVENNIVLLDMNEMSASKMPLSLVQQIVQQITLNFTCSLEKLFIVRAGMVFKSLWNIIKNFISEETAKKIDFVNKSDFSIFQKYISPDQIEEKYGGKHPNLTTFWPPQIPISQRKKKRISVNKKNINPNNENDEEQSVYYSLVNDSQQFFNDENLENYATSNFNDPSDNQIVVNKGCSCECKIF